jgi:hypothetical protein
LPYNTLNKVASQANYPGLPLAGIAHKKDKITLPKAVAKGNNCGSISLVQKAGRASERAKKRVAIEQTREEGEPGDQVGLRARKRAKVAMGAPRCSARHI